MAESFSNSNNQSSDSKAIASVAIGTTLIAVGPFFVEFSSLDAMGSSFYRMLIGGIAFLIIGLFRREKLPHKRFIWLYVSAAFMITFDLLLCNQSILYIGSGLATVLSNLEVMFLTLIGAIFYKEKLSHFFSITCLCIFIGIFFLIQPYLAEIHSHLVLGVFCALCASFVFSLYLLILKTITRKNSESSTASNLGVICMIGTTLLGIVMACIPSASFSLPATWNGILCVVVYSLMSQVLGWWFISQGISKLNLSTSGVLFLLQPALTFIGDCLFLGRNTEVIQLAGCLILLITVYKTVQNEERRKVIA